MSFKFGSNLHHEDILTFSEISATSLRFFLKRKGGPSGEETQGIVIKNNDTLYILYLSHESVDDARLVILDDVVLPEGTLVWVSVRGDINFPLTSNSYKTIGS